MCSAKCQRKLRYPNRKEIDSCFCNLQKEIKELSPQIVFLLGEKVYSAIEKHFGIKFDKWEEFHYSYKKYGGVYYIPIHHPSYIYVYKRRYIDQYIESVEGMVNMLINMKQYNICTKLRIDIRIGKLYLTGNLRPIVY